MIINKCPACKSKNYQGQSYSEEYWGGMYLVEEHGWCPDCGYRIEMAYSDGLVWYEDIVRGYKDKNGIYHPKNVRKHRRNRRRNKALKLPINPKWAEMI